MLFSVFVSVFFPLLHFDSAVKGIPSLGDFVPPTWLPEVVVQADGSPSGTVTHINFDAWILTNSIYSVGVLASLTLFLIRLGMLVKLIYRAAAFKIDKLFIIESKENRSSFSFFQFIYIGQADQLTTHEKQLIIDHERVHTRQLHSFDMLLVSVLGIFFWFNPLLKIYRKIFIQVHEFEADARAVEKGDVNNYCSLLAKVALLSSDFKLANHFSNSLTIKRIEMIRTIKSKIQGWKIAAILLIVPLFFFVVSCQDQVMSDITEIAKNSSSALIVPENIQARYEQLKREKPNSNYILLELNEEARQKLAEMEKKYGVPGSMEVFQLGDDHYKHTGEATIKGASASGIEFRNAAKNTDDSQTFAIIEYNDMTEKISVNSVEDAIFTVVEESATFAGGFENLGPFLNDNLKYPAEARKAGKEGTVNISFVVNADGSLSDFEILKGVDPQMDAEAMRVVTSFPPWIPGKQNGKTIRQRFVLPIKFRLNSESTNNGEKLEIQGDTYVFQITLNIADKGGVNVVSGQVLDKSGMPLEGANIIIVGTTQGTTSDSNGYFTIEPPNGNGHLAFSFVGYKTETLSF